jgi:ketosteroid isomerase-like protein
VTGQSEANVELAARFYEGWTSKEEMLSGLPGTVELCDPEVEWTTGEDGLTYQGREGVREAFERWLESFDDYRFEVERIVDCGGDRVLVVGTGIGRGASSGAEVRSVSHELLTVRDGLIIRRREFYDEREALEAAGEL